jgi:hypothetical protein
MGNTGNNGQDWQQWATLATMGNTGNNGQDWQQWARLASETLRMKNHSCFMEIEACCDIYAVFTGKRLPTFRGCWAGIV